jgi:hypothetical protein
VGGRIIVSPRRSYPLGTKLLPNAGFRSTYQSEGHMKGRTCTGVMTKSHQNAGNLENGDDLKEPHVPLSPFSICFSVLRPGRVINNNDKNSLLHPDCDIETTAHHAHHTRLDLVSLPLHRRPRHVLLRAVSGAAPSRIRSAHPRVIPCPRRVCHIRCYSLSHRPAVRAPALCPIRHRTGLRVRDEVRGRHKRYH